LPIHCARLAPLVVSDERDAIIACSDLQGIVPSRRGGEAELLGVALAGHLAELAEDRVLPPAARTGVILAGDLYSVPGANKRGGFGDVADVWAAFAAQFAWVAGVAGNHDDITNLAAIGAPNLHLLDGATAELDGLRIGGVGGIIGNPGKKMRRSPEDFLALIDSVVDEEIDMLVLHEGPNGALENQHGNADVRATVEASDVGLTVCGHSHWEQPLATHESGQILNVDARAVVLLVDADPRARHDVGVVVAGRVTGCTSTRYVTSSSRKSRSGSAATSPGRVPPCNRPRAGRRA
jgi:Icc protein